MLSDCNTSCEKSQSAEGRRSGGFWFSLEVYEIQKRQVWFMFLFPRTQKTLKTVLMSKQVTIISKK